MIMAIMTEGNSGIVEEGEDEKLDIGEGLGVTSVVCFDVCSSEIIETVPKVFSKISPLFES